MEDLDKFLSEYKAKLERERLELLTLSANVSVKTRSPRQEAAEKQWKHTPLWSTETSGIPAERDQRGGSLLGASPVTHDERMERRRKQREYRRCLDEQVAEKQRRKEREPSSPEHAYSYAAPHSSDSLARSASPPIRCHYRRPAHVPLPPARPLSAPRAEQFCIDDLAELRRLYTHR